MWISSHHSYVYLYPSRCVQQNTYKSHFSKNGCVPEKTFQGKNFSKSIISFQNTFWPTLNRFRPKQFSKNFRFFFVIFGPKKIRIFDFFGREILKVFSPHSKGLYCGNFELLYVSLSRTTTPCAEMRTNFRQKGQKRGFLDFSRTKNRKILFFIRGSFKGFYCGSFELLYTSLRQLWTSCARSILFAPPRRPKVTHKFWQDQTTSVRRVP